jgi:hypothetical protein
MTPVVVWEHNSHVGDARHTHALEPLERAVACAQGEPSETFPTGL